MTGWLLAVVLLFGVLALLGAAWYVYVIVALILVIVAIVVWASSISLWL